MQKRTTVHKLSEEDFNKKQQKKGTRHLFDLDTKRWILRIL